MFHQDHFYSERRYLSIEFTNVEIVTMLLFYRGSLVDIDVSRISVTGEVDSISSGESSAGVGYTSTSTSSY